MNELTAEQLGQAIVELADRQDAIIDLLNQFVHNYNVWQEYITTEFLTHAISKDHKVSAYLKEKMTEMENNLKGFQKYHLDKTERILSSKRKKYNKNYIYSNIIEDEPLSVKDVAGNDVVTEF